MFSATSICEEIRHVKQTGELSETDNLYQCVESIATKVCRETKYRHRDDLRQELWIHVLTCEKEVDQPVAWLCAVAKYKAINSIIHDRTLVGVDLDTGNKLNNENRPRKKVRVANASEPRYEGKTVREHANDHGLAVSLVTNRLRRGWTLKEALKPKGKQGVRSK